MDKTLLEPLNKLETSLNSLVQSLVTTNTFSAAPKAAKDLVAADDELTSALVTLKRHQDNYAEILRLRAEAEALNQNIKDTIRTCVSLRNELGDIHASILEDSDDDDEGEEEKYNTVDYDTLLAFAFRIGKHNAIARKDAEREAERADIEAKKKRDEKQQGKPDDTHTGSNSTQPIVNGPRAEQTSGTSTQGDTSAAGTQPNPSTTSTTTPTQHDLRTQQVQNVLRQMRHLQRITHMEQSAPYPDANLLRIGELGRVHYIRELEGEQAADRMVEDMVRKAELDPVEDDDEDKAMRRSESPEMTRRAPRPQQQQQQQQQRPVETRPKPKKAFDLDFPGGDDEDDEDEDD